MSRSGADVPLGFGAVLSQLMAVVWPKEDFLLDHDVGVPRITIADVD